MKISSNLSLGKAMTFELCKKAPFHSWFFYKEGFSPSLVDFALNQEQLSKNATVLDVFCGVGTTLLASKAAGLPSIGVDSSPLAGFVSKTKTDDYSNEDIEQVKLFVSTAFNERGKRPEISKWDFELFNARAAFPKRNYLDILSLRDQIEQQQGKVRNLLLLALLSILPQTSIVVKDGGVLKIDKRKRAMPVKQAFKRKIKQMLSDLSKPVKGPLPEVFLGDARGMDLEDRSVFLVTTSPPYLNNIDYSKIYGLELSLLHMSKSEAEETRMRSIRSFIGKNMKTSDMPPEVGDIGYKIPIIGTYFRDMEECIKEMHRVLVPKCAAYIVVSNSVIHNTHVLVDEVFAEMGERIGFSETEIIVGAERIADVKPKKVKTRESIVVLRK